MAGFSESIIDIDQEESVGINCPNNGSVFVYNNHNNQFNYSFCSLTAKLHEWQGY